MQTLTVKALHSFSMLSNEELEMVDGGKWNLKDFSKTTWNGAVSGGVTGAIYGAGGGTMTLPGVGTLTGAGGGAAGGFIVGGIAGAVGYTAREFLNP